MDKQAFARNTLNIYIECFAPEELFEDEWDDLSEEAKNYYRTYHVPCSGTGDMYSGCESCPFSQWDCENNP